MTTLSTADAWLLLALGWSVVVGFGVHEAWANWRERRRAARRLAASEEAFWASLTAYMEKARNDIAAGRPVGQIASVKRMREQIADNECRRLRADLDAWGQ